MHLISSPKRLEESFHCCILPWMKWFSPIFPSEREAISRNVFFKVLMFNIYKIIILKRWGSMIRGCDRRRCEERVGEPYLVGEWMVTTDLLPQSVVSPNWVVAEKLYIGMFWEGTNETLWKENLGFYFLKIK